MTQEVPVSIEWIKTVRKLGFLNHNYERPYPTHRSIDDYELHLPEFQNLSFLQHIERKLIQGSEELDVLDIGCGQGALLADLKEKYPTLNVFGISSHDYRDHYSQKELLDQVDYRTGDAHQLRTEFRGTKFDIVVSLYAFEYFADPPAVLKQAYMLCKEGGLLFIDKFARLTLPEAELLREYLRHQNIELNLKRFAPNEEKYDPSMYALALKRTSRKLSLPFRYCDDRPIPEPDDMGSSFPGIQLTYYFDGDLIARSGANPIISK